MQATAAVIIPSESPAIAPVVTPEFDSAGTKAIFRSKRVFYHAALDSGEAGWCFTVRGGRVYGPFRSRDIAEHILNGLIERFKRNGDTGGR